MTHNIVERLFENVTLPRWLLWIRLIWVDPKSRPRDSNFPRKALIGFLSLIDGDRPSSNTFTGVSSRVRSEHNYGFDMMDAFSFVSHDHAHSRQSRTNEPSPKSLRTIKRADLLDALTATCPSLSRFQSREILEMMIREIFDSLSCGESVRLRSFGVFAVREKSERIGRNPRTGVEAQINPRRVLTFKPSPVLSDAVNVNVL